MVSSSPFYSAPSAKAKGIMIASNHHLAEEAIYK